MYYREYKSILVIGLFLSLLTGCYCEHNHTNVHNDELVVVNVLDKDLYDDCHIKCAGSINIPFEKIEEESASLHKDACIIVYCSNYQCSTSEYAARTLRKKGFNNVYVYAGGIAEWYQQGLPVEGPQNEAYLKKPFQQFAAENTSDVAVITIEELAKKVGININEKGAA